MNRPLVIASSLMVTILDAAIAGDDIKAIAAVLVDKNSAFTVFTQLKVD